MTPMTARAGGTATGIDKPQSANLLKRSRCTNSIAQETRHQHIYVISCCRDRSPCPPPQRLTTLTDLQLAIQCARASFLFSSSKKQTISAPRNSHGRAQIQVQCDHDLRGLLRRRGESAQEARRYFDPSSNTLTSLADCPTGVKSFDVSLDTQTADVVAEESLDYATVLEKIKKTGKKVNSGEADGVAQAV